MQKCKLLFTPALMSSLYLYPRSITSQHNAYYVSNWILYITYRIMLICVVFKKNNKPNISAHGARRLRTKGWVDHKGFPFWSWCWPASDRLQNRYLIIGRTEKEKLLMTLIFGKIWSVESIHQVEKIDVSSFWSFRFCYPKLFSSSLLKDVHKISLRKWNPFKHTLMINR